MHEEYLLLKVDVHNAVTYLNQTPIFKWYVVRCYLQEWIPKRNVFKEMGDYVLKI